MNIKGAVTQSLSTLTTPAGAAVLGAVAASGAFKSPAPVKSDLEKVVDADPFKLSNFVAELKNGYFRLSKGYYFIVEMAVASGTNEKLNKNLSFHCNRVVLPGWRAKTQGAKIYGLEYEVITGLEQDPIWLTFNVDILHELEKYFLDFRKQQAFEYDPNKPSSYSPRYKKGDKDYSFEMSITVTDENFLGIHKYHAHDCFVKTVQNVQYGSGDTNHTEVTVEIVYETLTAEDLHTNRKTTLPPTDKQSEMAEWYKSHVKDNRLKVGPFTADISVVNQVKDTLVKVPQWFSDPQKI